MQRERLIECLTKSSASARAKAMKQIAQHDKATNLSVKEDYAYQLNLQTNNSCSSFTPSLAVYLAYNTGLKVCGICDRNTLNGALEFAAAATNAGLGYSIAAESFVTLDNKMQRVIVYGISLARLKEFKKLFEFNRQMSYDNTIEQLKKVRQQFTDIPVGHNFEPIAKKVHSKGGCVSIKNLYMQVASQLIEKYSKGEKLLECIIENGYSLEDFEKKLLLEEDNAYYEHDLLRVLIRHAPDKNHFAYSPCNEFCDEARQNGAFVAYVAKNTELLDLPKLVKRAKKNGFEAICTDTYKGGSLSELYELCKKNDILLLPADFIDSPRKKFSYEKCDVYPYLVENAYAVVGNQTAVNFNYQGGMFSQKMKDTTPSLDDRLRLYSVIGRGV